VIATGGPRRVYFFHAVALYLGLDLATVVMLLAEGVQVRQYGHEVVARFTTTSSLRAVRAEHLNVGSDGFHADVGSLPSRGRERRPITS